MTVKECYEQMGSDYEGVLGRLGSEAIVKRFALKFLQDPSFAQLKESLAKNDGEEAFRAAHTLKGICLNLSFDITISLENGKQYKGTVTIELTVGNIIDEGTGKLEITDFSNVIFKRIKN